MTITEIAVLASVILSIGTNVGLYIHLSSVLNARIENMNANMNSRFDSVERRLDLMQGALHELDIRLTKLER